MSRAAAGARLGLGGVARATLLALLCPLALAAVDTAQAEPAATRVDHVALHVADVAVSAAFYRDLFALREVPAPVAGPRWFDMGPVALYLIPGRSARVADDRRAHLALRVPALDPLLARLAARRIAWETFAGAPGSVAAWRADGVRQIFLRDPDGYWLEVNDAGPSSPP